MSEFREYKCPNCGFSAYAMDKLLSVKCRKCGALVETKPIPKVEESNIVGRKEGLKVS